MTLPIPRRALFQGLGAIGAGVLVGPTLGARAGTMVGPRARHAPRAQWLINENKYPGDGTWLRGRPAPAGDLEGFASTTSAIRGDRVDFYVSTPARRFRVLVYRMGHYQGLGARLVATMHNTPGVPQVVPVPDQYGTVDCDWSTSFSLTIDERFAPGQYLVRLELPNRDFRFVPLLVRDDSSSATYMYMSAVTTWQAYNTWGGYSLYRETNALGIQPLGTSRAVRVSFNRPYDQLFANGAADFVGNEFPLLFMIEGMGLDVTYWTDLDLHQRGPLLTRHKALLSLGHDEYYSPEMRAAVTDAVQAGVNVAFFGANFCYRKIRFEPDLHGNDRLMVNYRSTADPVMASDPAAATVNWSQYPSDQPESTFSGSIYGGADGAGSMVIEDTSSWLWAGTGLADGAVLPRALGGEFNHFNPLEFNPANVQIFGHSPVGSGVSDVTYVAEQGGGGVFCSGTGHWIYNLSNSPRLGTFWIPAALPGVTAPITTATQNILSLFGKGPAGNTAPSQSNTTSFY